MSTKKRCRCKKMVPDAAKSESQAQIQAPGVSQWPGMLARGGGEGKTNIKEGKPHMDFVFGPPWREDYRREVN